MSQPARVGVFSAKPYDKASFENASQAEHCHFTFISDALSELTAGACHNFDVVCAFVNDDLSDKTLSALAQSGVRHIAMRCAGYNNVDLDAARTLGLSVSRVPAYSPETVAEHAMALILTLNRKTHKAYNRVKEGNFEIQGLTGFTMFGKTVGIIGAGRIGHAFAKILLGFGCHVLCYDPVNDPALSEIGVTYTTLDTLLRQSDIISLHCPLNEDSYHLINDTTLEKMKHGVMLINTSRGGLVNTKSVIKGLKSGKIGYLGLDVYEMESELFFNDRSVEVIQDDDFSRLTSFHNVLITGHQGFFTFEALSQIAETTIGNILMDEQDRATSNAFLVVAK